MILFLRPRGALKRYSEAGTIPLQKKCISWLHSSSKETFLDTVILLISIFFMEIGSLCWWNFCFSISISPNFIFFFHFYICFQKFIYYKFIIFCFFLIIWKRKPWNFSCFHSFTFFITDCICLLHCFCTVCVFTGSATDLRERFLFSDVFNLHYFPAFMKASVTPSILLWRLQSFPLRFETHTQPICVFK